VHRSTLLPLLLAITCSAQAAGSGLQEGPLLVADDFRRFTAPVEDLGTAPETTYRWLKRVPLGDDGPATGIVTGAQGELLVRYSSARAPQDTGVWLEGLEPADATVEVLVGPSLMADRGHTAHLSYRAASADAAAGLRRPGAYHVELSGDFSGARDLKLWHGTHLLAAADIAPARDPERPFRLKVGFAGNRHVVWLDGEAVLEYWETAPEREGPGLIGLGGFYSAGAFDDFRVCAATLAAPLTPDSPPEGRFPPLVFQGRPFFVLGTFDRPATDTEAWLAAGGNTVICAVPDPGGAPQTWRQELQDIADWASAHRVAAIYYPLVPLYSTVDGQVTVTRPEEIPAKQEALQAMLELTADHPQTLGYWPFDEPENHLYKAHRELGNESDTDLARWIAEGMGWTYETLKSADPDAYVMPTIAWWTTYEHIAPIYDVNVPNEYPTYLEDAALTGPLYNVVHDATLAADAVEAAGRKGFVYMPGIFDNLGKPWRAPTLRELRYTMLAPLTQGAVGLLPWRLGRCSPGYKEAVVYPVMREVGRLRPWLTGRWVDGAVHSDRDAATADYLTEFPVRIKTLAEGDDAPMVEAPGVPDCSYMVRRHPDGSHLLLAVSNRKEPLDVCFSITGLGALPAAAHEALDFRALPIVEGTLTDYLEPFAVRAYIIEPQ